MIHDYYPTASHIIPYYPIIFPIKVTIWGVVGDRSYRRLDEIAGTAGRYGTLAVLLKMAIYS